MRSSRRRNPSLEGVIEHADEAVEVAVDVEQSAGLVVQAELQFGDGFEEFVERSVAAGQRDERVGVFGHQRFALVQGVDEVHMGDRSVRDFTCREGVRDHADHLPTRG